MLQALTRRQNNPLVRPSQKTAEDGETKICTWRDQRPQIAAGTVKPACAADAIKDWADCQARCEVMQLQLRGAEAHFGEGCCYFAGSATNTTAGAMNTTASGAVNTCDYHAVPVLVLGPTLAAPAAPAPAPAYSVPAIGSYYELHAVASKDGAYTVTPQEGSIIDPSGFATDAQRASLGSRWIADGAECAVNCPAGETCTDGELPFF